MLTCQNGKILYSQKVKFEEWMVDFEEYVCMQRGFDH